MSTLSTHVLDAALGTPAAGLSVVLVTDPAGSARPLVSAETDADGRYRLDDDLTAGVYALTFDTGAWFAIADRDTFFPEVRVAFAVDPGQAHYHVALLLSPYSYTTYRGS